MPLESPGSLPPKVPVPPSPSFSPPGMFRGAKPLRIRPPHWPRAREPTAAELVNTIGLVAVPWAMISPPRSMTRVPVVAWSPKMVVPAWMVSVAPARTKSAPWIRYWLLAVQVVVAGDLAVDDDDLGLVRGVGVVLLSLAAAAGEGEDDRPRGRGETA